MTRPVPCIPLAAEERMLNYGRFRLQLDTVPEGVMVTVLDRDGFVCAVADSDAQSAVMAALAAAEEEYQVDAKIVVVQEPRRRDSATPSQRPDRAVLMPATKPASPAVRSTSGP